jgi:uncharacterized protein YqgV (UPF0045/DUF77 family)
MNTISAEISLYPLRQLTIGESVECALHALRTYDIELNTGPMSTVLAGNENEVFAALRGSFRAACDRGDAVMVAIVSNACPLHRDES